MWFDLGNGTLANMTQERHDKFVSAGTRDKIIINKHSPAGSRKRDHVEEKGIPVDTGQLPDM